LGRLTKKLVMDFDQVKYICSSHAEEQIIERKNVHHSKARRIVERMAERGKLLIDIDDMRYIKYGSYYLPCVKCGPSENNTFKVKTVLNWYMVEHRIQNIIRKYHGEPSLLAQ
jgi:hypothetical protein